MRIFFPVVFVILLFTATHGQTRVTDLKPAHAAALEQFLSKNPIYQFLSENALDADYLKEMRQGISGGKPYYNVGDFNRDGIVDFALILRRKGAPKDNGEGMAESHRYDYPLAIVIFNGVRQGKFTKAFLVDIEKPFACFLDVEVVRKKKRLYFGVFETDDISFFSPAGKGYVVKYPDMP